MTMQHTDFRLHSLEFRGSAGEFFKIWLVNILLTLLTLGIYSAWAKIRTQRYLYGNTYLFGSSFEYLAEPMQILKGRMIAAAFFGLFILSEYYSSILYGILFIGVILLTPLIIIRSMRFNLANTAYRNIRLGFDGNYRSALLVFMGLPLLVSLTAGLTYPYFVNQWKKFLIDNSRYGTMHFSMRAATPELYRTYLSAGAAFLVAIVVFGFFVSMVGKGQSAAVPTAVFGVLMLHVLLLIYGYMTVNVTNLIINHSQLHTHRLTCNLEIGQYCWLVYTNVLGIILSFGLLTPWAIIRLKRYKLGCIAIQVDGDFERFVAAESEKIDAIGEEFSDLLDIDFGL